MSSPATTTRPNDLPTPLFGRTWTITTTSGYVLTGHLPTWADTDPSTTGISLERLGAHLADIRHHTAFPGQNVNAVHGSGPPQEAEILWGHITCHPYAEDPDPRIPVAAVAVIDDHWITDLDPDGLTEFARQLRAQADRLEHDVRPQLIAARTDWATHHRN